jgi:hypothetical protein
MEKTLDLALPKSLQRGFGWGDCARRLRLRDACDCTKLGGTSARELRCADRMRSCRQQVIGCKRRGMISGIGLYQEFNLYGWPFAKRRDFAKHNPRLTIFLPETQVHKFWGSDLDPQNLCSEIVFWLTVQELVNCSNHRSLVCL